VVSFVISISTTTTTAIAGFIQQCLYLQSHIIGIVLFLLLLLMMSSFVSFSVSVGLLVVVFVHFFVETFVNQNQYKPGIYETTDDWT